MIGLVLAAGSGRRLWPDTEQLPKTLLPVDGERTILDVILHNLADCGLTDIVIVVGHMAGAIAGRAAELEQRHGVRLRLIHNDRVSWNNAYSLWLAREYFNEGALLINGDTVHPATVEQLLLAEPYVGIQLAVDAVKQLTDEAMKVRLDAVGQVVRITKNMPPGEAAGEYIGVAMLSPDSAGDLAACLAETWRTDPGQYYEDGLQLLATRTAAVAATRIGTLDWVEVDDHTDLARARDIACRY